MRQNGLQLNCIKSVTILLSTWTLRLQCNAPGHNRLLEKASVGLTKDQGRTLICSSLVDAGLEHHAVGHMDDIMLQSESASERAV